MPSIETMTLEELEATMAALRARRKVLKATNTVAQRKIVTLARRRERLMEQLQALDAQIDALRGAQQAPSQAVEPSRRARRRGGTVTTGQEAIIACVTRHGCVSRATIVEDCQLSPATASAYLRQLCAEGQLRRHGEKRATTYTLPE